MRTAGRGRCQNSFGDVAYTYAVCQQYLVVDAGGDNLTSSSQSAQFFNPRCCGRSIASSMCFQVYPSLSPGKLILSLLCCFACQPLPETFFLNKHVSDVRRTPSFSLSRILYMLNQRMCAKDFSHPSQTIPNSSGPPRGLGLTSPRREH